MMMMVMMMMMMVMMMMMMMMKKKKKKKSFGRSGIICPRKQRQILEEYELHYVKTELRISLISYNC
jgi:hypothetical protein